MLLGATYKLRWAKNGTLWLISYIYPLLQQIYSMQNVFVEVFLIAMGFQSDISTGDRRRYKSNISCVVLNERSHSNGLLTAIVMNNW